MSHLSQANGDLHIDEHVLKQYKPVKKIAKGQYGIVWRAKHTETGQLLAVKKIYNAFQSEIDAQRTYREINYLERLALSPSLSNPNISSPHPNIIRLMDVLPSENELDIYLVFEYMETDLRELLKKRLLKPTHYPFIIFQLFHALQFIHSASLIHRDISPSNILVNAACQVKLADFGLCRSIASSSQTLSTTISREDVNLTEYIAVRWYRSPEVLLTAPYSFGLDIWSAGCVFAEMLSTSHKTLFPGSNTSDQLSKIFSILGFPSDEQILGLFGVSSQNPPSLSFEVEKLIQNVKMLREDSPTNEQSQSTVDNLQSIFKETDTQTISLLSQMLTFDPLKRISAKDILKNDIFDEFRKEYQEFEQLSFSYPIILPFPDHIRHPAEKYRDILYKKYGPHIQSTEKQLQEQQSNDKKRELRKMIMGVQKQLEELETTSEIEKYAFLIIQNITEIVRFRKSSTN